MGSRHPKDRVLSTKEIRSSQKDRGRDKGKDEIKEEGEREGEQRRGEKGAAERGNGYLF